jgi:hypothetical protein
MNDYGDGTGKWHSQTITKFKVLSDESLKYIMFDCRQALKAMPDNPKAGQYMDEIHYCLMELAARRIKSFKN